MFSIAVAGKGGSGKTSLASLIIRFLLRKEMGPVLAVDADANANLGDGLGLEVDKTVGSTLASFNEEKINIPLGLTKEAYLEVKLNEAIVESKGMDLITMGRSEGTGCYCYPNTVLRSFIDKLSTNYKFIVMDNEAGMEHMSRKTTEHTDELFIVSDHSIKGVRAIARILELIKELKLDVRHTSVVLSMVPGEIDSHIIKELDRLGISVAAEIPYDAMIKEYDFEQKSLLELSEDSEAVKAVDKIMGGILAIVD